MSPAARLSGPCHVVVHAGKARAAPESGTLEGDRLELELIEDVQEDYQGTPTPVFVAGLYTSRPWERISS